MPHAPVVHVSAFEADAYARWAGCRLPTEFEWETVAAPLDSTAGNFADDGRLHPLGAEPAQDEATRWFEAPRRNQLFGDVWEWTSSAYGPYPRYQPQPGTLGEYKRQVHEQPTRIARRFLRHATWPCAGKLPELLLSARPVAVLGHQARQGSGLVRLADRSSAAYQFFDFKPPPTDMLREVLAGLSSQPKFIAPKYFYDERGSRLFEAITRLPEYYLTRTEMAILDRCLPELRDAIGKGVCLVEYGAGSSLKIRRLLETLRQRPICRWIYPTAI